MTTAAELIAQALGNLATQARRREAQLLNVQPNTGSPTEPRRFMRDTGFLEARQFEYVRANAATYAYNDTDDLREINQIVVAGYGLSADARRLTSSRPADRVVHEPGESTNGVCPHPEDPRFLMSGTLNAELYSTEKTTRVLRGVTTNAGPAPHFIVTRRGDVYVGPSIDATVNYVPPFSENGVIIAIEAAVMILAADHAARRYDRMIEMPLTSVQAIQLAVLIKKLSVAVASSFPRTFNDALTDADTGFVYGTRSSDGTRLNTSFTPITRGNFLPQIPTQPVEPPRISYELTTNESFFRLVDEQGSFDLATEVWRPYAVPAAVGDRAAVRAALSEVDTAGAETALIGAYVTIAAGARSAEMQEIVRREVFVQRRRITQNEHETLTNSRANAQQAAITNQLPRAQVTNPEAHVYDFTTGLWGSADPDLNMRSV